MERWEGFIGEGNAEDIFGMGQSRLWVAVNGYGRMLPPQHSAFSTMQAIKMHFLFLHFFFLSCTQLRLLPVHTLIQVGLITLIVNAG